MVDRAGYFDFAGGEDTGHIVIAGYFAHVDTWKSFEEHWRGVLDRPPKVAAWHKRETGRGGSIRQLLGDDGLRDRETELRQVIAKHHLTGLSQSITRVQYRRYVINEDTLGHRVGMYWPCFGSILKRIGELFEAASPADTVSLYFEPTPKLDESIHVVVRSYFDRERFPQTGALIRSSTVPDDYKVSVVQFQAADMLAWNIHAGNRDISHERTEEFLELKRAARFGHAWTLEKDIENYSRINNPGYTNAADPVWRLYQSIVRREQASQRAGAP